MITTAELKTQTRRDLADLARQHEITGWHAMRKAELIDALRKLQRRQRRQAAKASGNGKAASKSGAGKASTGGRTVTAKAGKTSKAPKASASKSAKARKPAASEQSRVSPKSRVAPKASATRAKSRRAGETAGGKRSAAAKSKPQVKSSALTDKKSSRRKPAPKRAATQEPAKKTSKLSPASLRKLREKQAMRERLKDLSVHVLVGGKAAAGDRAANTPAQPNKDRAILMVRDAFWLQAAWEVTRASVQRAQAALGEHWHMAKPVLRLVSITDASANAAEQKVRDIPIHGGVNNWYIDVLGEPTRFRVIVGYAVDREQSEQRFYALCRSNIVETPAPGSCDPIDGHWQDIAEDYERVFSLSGGHNEGTAKDLRDVFEERLKRPMQTPNGRPMGESPDLALRRERELPFEVDAELIVFGSTAQGSAVSLGGEPVKLSPDGTFTVRMELPDRRQVLPVVATSRDGMRQRTTIISVERNTKVMEPYRREEGDL